VDFPTPWTEQQALHGPSPILETEALSHTITAMCRLPLKNLLRGFEQQNLHNELLFETNYATQKRIIISPIFPACMTGEMREA
jgi:hypothetical protein